ncbi:nucleotidyltransferase family protein [Fusibacillus kribbianus]|uniref:Sugar phosphate nucleotidyltransferase n=1 Tax=Fusibacillus kribbianus TaxID=3044208 RepID=A0AAP4EX52_9FIRM|nr:sugar phosphate nucleotidyltransferase [Ruminococcus sp. YH-rum2234]MDI9242199.1 sugar phosphate nucleotidyltransferase [Ruminococcus sp. YH-rum2234]
MKKPVLVIMAAGMGSRYGGLKQIDPVDKYGNIIMDFSIYDAKQAGFEKVVFIIKKENEGDFKAAIGDRIAGQMETAYVFQDIHNIPAGFEVPAGRVKPWGTGHAILSCIDEIDGPFVVINADDYYGREAFRVMYDYLVSNEDDEKYRFAMVGYQVENTLTENGSVARGVCGIDDQGQLASIIERTSIERRDDRIVYEEEGASPVEIPEGTLVSMNFWGFSRGILTELSERFPAFLNKALRENPMKGEFFIPTVVSDLIEEGRATVQVLHSHDRWFGVTYKEDKPFVMAAIKERKAAGLYPEKLWE